MRSRQQQGIALIVTLIMLSVVTLMAITFLGISRRQRAAVEVSEDYTVARLMADTALSRAEAEILAQSTRLLDPFGYDIMVSTNYINPEGFDPRQPVGTVNPTNVNYDFVQGSRTPLNEQQRLQVIANLQLDPRPPVYVKTNENPNAPLDFRFYLDLNRNGRFETNGWQPVLDAMGQPIVIQTNGQNLILSNFFVGDPEWIGVLENPNAPHSATNRFIGRYAYIVLPAGRSLDINHIYNNARTHSLGGLGYYRNQGVGSWELNLAAFWRDLNTNVWRQYDYRGDQSPSVTDTSLDALGFLRYRYGNNYGNLLSIRALFGSEGENFVRNNLIDDYTDGPHSSDWTSLHTDNDQPDQPWPGSPQPNRYTTLNDFFNTNKVPATWLDRLTNAQRGLSSYDRYTFYRMLAQLGTDSAPANEDKININFDNRPGVTNRFQEWNPYDFFITTADRLLKVSRIRRTVKVGKNEYVSSYWIGDTPVRPEFSVTNIMIYPTNEYTPTIHRILQVAVNIYDATTNRSITSYPYLPTVFRPVFTVTNEEVYIRDFVEVTNAAFLNQMILVNPADLHNPQLRPILLRTIAANPDRVVLYDVPFIIGAKKGLPNFNEFSMMNIVQVTRRAEVVKRTPMDLRPFQTNLLYTLSISNQFGIELWNSYSNAYPRPLRMVLAGDLSLLLTNRLGNQSVPLQMIHIPYTRSTVIPTWPPKQFRVPIYTNIVFVPESSFIPFPPQLLPGRTNLLVYPRGLGFYIPQWGLAVTNRFFVALVDIPTDRIVDFVAFGNMHTGIDITRALAGRSAGGRQGSANILDRLWSTNRIGGQSLQYPTEGVLEQMEIALGNIQVSDRIWRSYNRAGPGAQDKAKAIDLFREFCGLTPLTYVTPRQRAALRSQLQGRIAMQAPFAPVRKFVQEASWQVNDPLVHYMMADLMDPRARPDDPFRTNAIRYVSPPTVLLTNSNLGVLNNRYRPWGGNPNQSYDILARDPGVKDPGIESPDDWDFPGQKFPNIGWLGRVHRGTPWQTIYLKSKVVNTNLWYLWAGSLGTHPTNDWRFVDVFTTALNEEAAQGLLGVNQTNIAAWSAVLSGISVLTNTTPIFSYRTNHLATAEEMFIEPNSPQLYKIVEGIIRTRALRAGLTNETLRMAAGYRARFHYLGEILSVPELTMRSPFINTNNVLNDMILERIPQQILSLLKADDPQFVIYAFGQALHPAPNSVYTGPGIYHQMCTNYEVTSEFACKAVIRVVETPEGRRIVVENYQEIPME